MTAEPGAEVERLRAKLAARTAERDREAGIAAANDDDAKRLARDNQRLANVLAEQRAKADRLRGLLAEVLARFTPTDQGATASAWATADDLARWTREAALP